MHIIFGDDQAHALSEKYTVVELDTIKFMPSGTMATAYAVIETVPIDDLPTLEFQKDLHKNFIENYRKKNWSFCEQAIENLLGSFGKELDSFYAAIQERVNNYKDNDPGDDWDYAITKADPLQS